MDPENISTNILPVLASAVDERIELLNWVIKLLSTGMPNTMVRKIVQDKIKELQSNGER